MTGLIPFSPVVTDAAAIGVGAVCGALCRHHIGKAATERISKDPNLKYLMGWHTAGINVVGSFILGGVFGMPMMNQQNSGNADQAVVRKIVQQQPKAPMVTPASAKSLSKSGANGFNSLTTGMTPRLKLMLGVGFCGSFTTFSTYSVDLVNMMAKGEMTRACSYLIVNNVGGICAAAAGMLMMRKIFKV